jgi:hypothetical protein
MDVNCEGVGVASNFWHESIYLNKSYRLSKLKLFYEALPTQECIRNAIYKSECNFWTSGRGFMFVTSIDLSLQVL